MPLRITPHSYLYIGLAISLCLHALVLALRFTSPPGPPPLASRLEIVLINAYDVERPVEPVALAQADMDGGGDADDGLARSPLPPAMEAVQLPGAADAAAPEQPGDTARELLTRPESDTTLAEAMRRARAAETVAPPFDAAAAIAVLTQQYAALSRRVEEYNRRPRRHYFAPSTSASPYAEYVENWRERIEDVGNRLYGELVPHGMYGTLRLTVFLRADGSVENLSFDTLSIHPELNRAARIIVERAAPFAPFPEAIRHETDVIAITRTWHFENDAIVTEQN